MSIFGFDHYKGVPFDQINGKSNYLYIEGEAIKVHRAEAPAGTGKPERATLDALRNKVEKLCGNNCNDLELRTLAAFINRKIVAYNQRGLRVLTTREVQIPRPTVSFFAVPGPALVVGAWQPGIPEKAVTVAIDPELKVVLKNHTDPTFRPDFVGDIMKIPNKELGERKYSKIVFQGVCPVALAMGARRCSGDAYPKVDASELALKMKGLISEKGGFLFFRHCIETAHEEGIENPKQREKFIQSFQGAGMQLIQPEDYSSVWPCNYAPDPTIPDLNEAVKHKWDFRNGSLIFYMPPDPGKDSSRSNTD